MKMYTVSCKNCGKKYESRANRSGVCPDCKKIMRSRNNTRYAVKTYDCVRFYVPKGAREEYKQFAYSHGMSLNEFINEAIDLYAEKLESEDHKNEQE